MISKQINDYIDHFELF